jgi:DNA (cytosine-5)-methyltransferase 1
VWICIFAKTNMRHGSLFSGIGGFDLASEWMGWENVFHCEWNEFGKKVLHHYWPNAESFDDITKTDFTKYANTIDILTGGFPCQPYSQAGQRKGKEDERHLWPEMLRAIQEIKPKYIVGENVFGLLNWNGGMVFDEVHSDLESAGYEVQAVVIPAAAVNAPHGRDRVWFVATNPQFKSEGRDGGTNNETERNIRRGNEGDVFGTLRSDGITTNPKECGCRGGMCERCADGERKLLSDEQRRSEMGCEVKGHSGIGDVANTDSIRLQHTEETRNIQEGTRTAQSERSESTKPIKTNGSYGNVADTHGIGFQRKGGSTELEGRRFGFNNPQNNKTTWDNFPTQSPICGGDDGLPTELDGITFSKWRNESIKAYGNAIVPQVAYEIFKAIKMTNGN